MVGTRRALLLALSGRRRGRARRGYTHAITWRGKRVRMFHYHATLEYPYTLGCFRGTPVRAGPPG